MRKVTLLRNPSTDEGTFGVMLLDDHSTYATLELPWKDNASMISCIPPGEYTCKWIYSPKHGDCFQVMDVPKRSMIEIHSANWAGDASKGKLSQLLGCISLGKEVTKLTGQLAVTASKAAVDEFEAKMGTNDFKLVILQG